MKRLRMGLIGCGAIAQIMHIPYLIDLDEKFELVALADTHQPTLESVADHYGIAARYTDWRDLVRHPGLDAVVICHNGSHHESVTAALDAGLDIFCEKPLAWNLRLVEAVAARAAQSDRIVQMGYHKLYDPAFAYARQHVHQMRDLGFGRITVLHPANELGLSPYRIRRGPGVIQEGHLDPAEFDEQVPMQRGGLAEGDLAPLVDEALGSRKADPALRLAYGILTISLIHQVYTLHGFLGAPQRVVQANVWRQGLSIHALVEYPNDLRISIDWHQLNNLKDYREEYAFFGNHDRVIMQLPSPYFRNFPSPIIIQGYEGELAWEKRVIVSYEEAFRSELLAFYDNVQARRQPALSSLADAVQHSRFIQQLIDAVAI
ncbi:MAG: Gfo/Idh/MocA family oxidoreductase [Anaerolineae bacterium]|nr:Gfo/Idh/MocA family oxidoreductase [Anaerolineae bacterium]